MKREAKHAQGGSHHATDPPWPGSSTPGWDPVDEAGWESFPASDPPAYGPPSKPAPKPPRPRDQADDAAKAADRQTAKSS